MSEKIDSKAWTGDFPNRQNAPFTVRNGRKMAKVVLIAVFVTVFVCGLLVAGGLI
ncbi:MAG: hypothetical protein ABL893_19985 [Hyphomicrobium sp.]